MQALLAQVPETCPNGKIRSRSVASPAHLLRATWSVFHYPTREQWATEVLLSNCCPAQSRFAHQFPLSQKRANSDIADVAQLVEHFTRNEGVGSSSLPVGLHGFCRGFVACGDLDVASCDIH